MYATIYIYETYFQKSIIDYLIKYDFFDNENSLVIDATSHKLIIKDVEYKINFNKIKLLIPSLQNIAKLEKNFFCCETLVSTHITGINALFLSSFIKTKKKIIIDDGIGTPVLLQNQSLFNRKVNYQIRFFIVKFFLLFWKINLSDIKNTINNIAHYYTIYKNISFPIKESFSVTYLNFYEKEYKIVENETCFIGTPLIEFNFCTQNIYQNLLIGVKNKYGNYKYYLHPDEYIALTFKIEGIKFIKLEQNIENYFWINGIPKTVIGFTSSAMLNFACSKNAIGNINFHYIKKRIYGRPYDELYYKIMENNNIIDSGIII